MIYIFPAFASAATILYTYDDDGQVTTATYNDAVKIEYAYDDSGNRTQKTVNLYPNITLSLSSLAFGSIHVSETSSAQTITITNTGLGKPYHWRCHNNRGKPFGIHKTDRYMLKYNNPCLRHMPDTGGF